jgi:hypothetical protein
MFKLYAYKVRISVVLTQKYITCNLLEVSSINNFHIWTCCQYCMFIRTAFDVLETVEVTDYLRADTHLYALTRCCLSVPIATALERYVGMWV